MAYGWRTRKQHDHSFRWEVYRVEYQKPLHILETGYAFTRASAARWAKKAVMIYRSGARG
jgi:hypothetical protein